MVAREVKTRVDKRERNKEQESTYHVRGELRPGSIATRNANPLQADRSA